jgi:hypothetical protein
MALAPFRHDFGACTGRDCILGVTSVGKGGNPDFDGLQSRQGLPGRFFRKVELAGSAVNYFPILRVIYDFLFFVRLDLPVASFKGHQGCFGVMPCLCRGVR